MEIGTGTGVLSIILAKKRNIQRIIATDNNPRAVRNAIEEFQRFQLSNQIEVIECNLFPENLIRKPRLIVFNPPWIPGKPTSLVETSVFDEDLTVLKAFLKKLPHVLDPEHGVCWLFYSNFAEILGLQEKDAIRKLFSEFNLEVVDHLTKPVDHTKSYGKKTKTDLLAKLRKLEIVSLYCLKPKNRIS